MILRIYQLPALLSALTILCSLGGCSSINSHLAAGMADDIPHWAGGLPADAPPRPGTAEYHQMMKERERERLMPKTDDTTSESPDHNGMRAVH